MHGQQQALLCTTTARSASNLELEECRARAANMTLLTVWSTAKLLLR